MLLFLCFRVALHSTYVAVLKTVTFNVTVRVVNSDRRGGEAGHHPLVIRRYDAPAPPLMHLFRTWYETLGPRSLKVGSPGQAK